MWVGKVFQTKVQCLIKIDVRIYTHTHTISLPSIKKEKNLVREKKIRTDVYNVLHHFLYNPSLHPSKGGGKKTHAGLTGIQYSNVNSQRIKTSNNFHKNL